MGDWTTFLLEPIYAMVDLALERPLAAVVASSAILLVLFASFSR
jgi:hypothetical protein